MQLWKFAVLALAGLVMAACSRAPAAGPHGATPLRFSTDWRAEAELGGYYQALAEGDYARHGLAVSIVPGGPGVNVPQLVASGAVDLGVGSNSFIVMNLAAEHVPVRAVAAFMQKDPQVLIAHPDAGIASLADMKGHPILLADASVSAFWLWLKAKYGLTDDQVRKYNFNNAPFLADKRVVEQGYVTSEPYTLEKEGHMKPAVFLLADQGYPGYAGMVLASDASHFYANMDQGRPFPIVHDVAAMLEGHRTLKTLASHDDLVIPGHDPLVLERFAPPSPDLAGHIARLDADPLT